VSVATSAQSLAIFAGYYNVYGLGPRNTGSTREGSFPGTHSWTESLKDVTDYALPFDTRVDGLGNQYAINTLSS
jgi:hypothetical protein